MTLIIRMYEFKIGLVNFLFELIINLLGGVLKWEQQCKIIHMCSRKYLTVNKENHVTLTSNHTDPRTVFRLHPVIRVRLHVFFLSIK